MADVLPDLRFRPFAAGDLAVLEGWLARGDLGGPAAGRSLAALERRLTADPRICCQSAHDGGLLVGFLRLDWAPDAAAEVTLIVRPGERRRGVGRAVLEQALALARARGLRRLWAVVQVRNAAAQRLFEAAGFELEPSTVPGHVCLVRLVHRGGAAAARPLEIS